jgi:type VI secretion system secreted protein VgrG
MPLERVKSVSKLKSHLLVVSVVMALAGFLPRCKAAINLGTAASFAVLGASTVMSTGDTVLIGNLGVYPGTSISGFTSSSTPGPGVVYGTTYTAGPVAMQALADASSAYNTLAAQTSTMNLTGMDLGNLTLTSGVYFFSSSAQLTGTLTLSGTGNFIFQIGSTLTTASASSIILENGATAANVYWQVGSSAALGTTTAFDGTIIANQSVTLDTGADVDGRAIALNAAVTLNDNLVTAVPETGTLITGALPLLPFGANWLRRRMLRRNQTTNP